MIAESNELYLIDGEHGKVKGLKFYDLVYFYIRLYTKLCRPDIADKFLKLLSNSYKFTSTERILFYILLAQRAIGGYYDATNDGKTDLSFLHELREKVLIAGLDTVIDNPKST